MDEKKTTILVVEDEELLLSAIVSKLKLQDIDAIPCTSGKDALEILSKLTKVPDAIWLDFYLKDMDGFEFMKALKKNDDWIHIPTIVVSNSASPEKVNNMLALGVKKYYLKAENRLDDIIISVKEFMKGESK